MQIRHVPREKDERLLSMIAMRCEGQTLSQIAQTMGIHSGNVSVQTAKIRDAYHNHDPKDFQAGKYW